MSKSNRTRSIILVVEDETLVRHCAVSELEERGFTVIAACNAEDGMVEFVGEPGVAIVFTDINMPGAFNGLSLTRQISELRPDVHLIVTSGLSPPDGTMAAGADFLMKPYDFNELVKLIKLKAA